MNIVASTLARFGHSGLAVFAGSGPTLAVVAHDREALGRASGMPVVFSERPRDE